jgi:hypothetical protein
MNQELTKKLNKELEYFCRKCPSNGTDILDDHNLDYDVDFDNDIECECPKCGEVFREDIDDVNYIVMENFDIPRCCDVCKIYQFVEHLKNEL